MIKLKPLPDQATLLRIFTYDPATGALVRKMFRGMGKPAGTKKPRGIQVFVDRGQFAAHRIIWKMVTGKDPSALLDHRNCDPHDNRWVNLRDATHPQNNHNQRLRSDNLSGFKGVHIRKRQHAFRAVIEKDGKRYNLGDFRSPEEAHAAYRGAAKVLFGKYSNNG
jgi:hypothetical protein